MSAPRKFDHAEARRLRAEGQTYAQIAAELGVSLAAVRHACDDDARAKDELAKQRWRVAHPEKVQAIGVAYRKRRAKAGCSA